MPYRTVLPHFKQCLKSITDINSLLEENLIQGLGNGSMQQQSFKISAVTVTLAFLSLYC